MIWYAIKGYPQHEGNADGVVRSKRRSRQNLKFSPTINPQFKTFTPAKVIEYDKSDKITLKNTCFSKRLSRDDVLALLVLYEGQDTE